MTSRQRFVMNVFLIFSMIELAVGLFAGPWLRWLLEWAFS
jgi:hypothetical protein